MTLLKSVEIGTRTTYLTNQTPGTVVRGVSKYERTTLKMQLVYIPVSVILLPVGGMP